jgi:AraC family transcriptional regulator
VSSRSDPVMRMPKDKPTTEYQPNVPVGMREGIPDERLASREMQIFGGVEVARHQWLRGEKAFPLFKGHLVSVHLSGPVWSTTRLDDEVWEGRPVRGDVEVFPAGKRVERAIDGASEDINVLLDGVFLKRVAAETGANPDRLEVFDRFNTRDPQIERLLLSFLPELETEGLGSELYAESLANVLAVHLLREHSSLGHARLANARKSSREFREAGGLSERALKSATDYINDNLASELTLAEIASVANLSPYHFARMFKQSTGMPPHRYLIGQRLECAKGLLARTELSISGVAQACGFSHQGHLARHFRNLLGTTPGEFRRECSR